MGNNLLEIGAVSQTAWSSVILSQKLTPRQRDVLALLCEGLPNKLIARRLDISNGTVKVHIVHIHRALGVSSRVQAVLAARNLGLGPQSAGKAEGDQATAVTSIAPCRIWPVNLRLPAPDREPLLPQITAFKGRRLSAVAA